MMVKIRFAKNHDARKIYEFLCEKEEFLFDFREFEIHYRTCIADGDNIYLVAVDDRNDAIGFISCHGEIVLHQGGMVYQIKELYTEKKYRKNGIARLLFKQLQEVLSQRIYQSLEVGIHARRTDLAAFYKHCGLAQTHLQFTKEQQ